jgi:hypothetical protein
MRNRPLLRQLRRIDNLGVVWQRMQIMRMFIVQLSSLPQHYVRLSSMYVLSSATRPQTLSASVLYM